MLEQIFWIASATYSENKDTLSSTWLQKNPEAFQNIWRLALRGGASTLSTDIPDTIDNPVFTNRALISRDPFLHGQITDYWLFQNSLSKQSRTMNRTSPTLWSKVQAIMHSPSVVWMTWLLMRFPRSSEAESCQAGCRLTRAQKVAKGIRMDQPF